MLKRILLCIVFAIALFNGSCVEEDDTITTFTVGFDSLVGEKIENIEVEESHGFIRENHPKTMGLYAELIKEVKEYLEKEGVEIQ